MSGVWGKEGDPAGEVPSVFAARFWKFRIGRGKRRRGGIIIIDKGCCFGVELAREVEVGEGDVAGALDEDVFGF